MDENNLRLEVRMVDKFGRTYAMISMPLSEECAYIGWRRVEEMSLGIGSMDSVARSLEVREVRRDLLARSGEKAGHQIADFLQDREGWHGRERQESTNEALRERAKRHGYSVGGTD